MQFEINNKKARLNQKNFSQVKRLLQFSLDRFRIFISRVKIVFDDVNGPKGGVDKRCRVMVKLRTSGQVVVQSEGTNYLQALNNSLDTMMHALWREIDRRRTSSVRKNRREMRKLSFKFVEDDA